jgi:hypothetical protein
VDAAVEDVLGQRDARSTGGDGPEELDEGAPAGPRPRPGGRLLAFLLVVVNLPVVVATVRALTGGWQPMGDNGILLVRARDVGTEHHPLLGTWTSASALFETNLNNPGPLYFDAIALPIKVLGPWVGLAVGVMLVNMAASSFAVVVSRRISGAESMVAVALVVVGLQFAMGSELLYDVWQPNALVLPFLAFLVGTAALACGEVATAPWVVGIGSLVVQTHLSHAVPVLVITLVAIGLCTWTRRRRNEPPAWHRPFALSAIVAVVAWAQPVIEQFTGEGDGNLSRIVEAGSTGGATPIGWDRAPRLMAQIMVRGPWFTRDTYGRAIPPIAADAPAYGAVTFGPAVAVLVGLAVALTVVGVWGLRTGRRGLSALSWVALVAAVTGLLALATAPVNTAGISVHQMRWLWPIAALITAVLLTTLLSLVPSSRRVRGGLLGVACAVALAVAAANMPTYLSASKGPTDSPALLDEGLELVHQLGVLEGRGTVLYDPETLLFGEPYSGMTFAEMQDRDIPFVFDDEGFIRQFGEGRRNDGSADLRMWQEQGGAAEEVPPGTERVAYVETESGPVALMVEPID